MARVNITGAEYPIGKVFSDDFAFMIPHYQRPYAWETEHAEELLDDLLAFMGNGEEPINDINPYFLGSIVLIKGDAPDSQVVDGQQRLTTFSILLAAIRALTPKEFATDLNTFIFEKGNAVKGTPNRYRLLLRERDKDFFQKYIQTEGGIEQFKELHEQKLPDAKRNIRDNALLYLRRLNDMPERMRQQLAQFIINRCYLIIVSTPDLDSAYRIFSVLNDRGMDLSHTDILKAETIGKIPEEEQERYTKDWEDIEDMLGRDAFQDLFAHIRMTYLKSKPRESLLKGFREHVNPAANPRHFIDEILYPLADAYYDIVNSLYQTTRDAEQLNCLSRWLNRIDNFDWLPPAILFYSLHNTDHDILVQFFTKLERLAAGMMICRANINQRLERYGRLLVSIEKKEDLLCTNSPLELTEEEKQNIINQLNGNIYHIRYMPRYVLLRLDADLSEGAAYYDYAVISVEHVLPQSPNVDSVWVQWFPTPEERDKYTHCLGNLVLLSHRKNSQARNYDFDRKKEKYFKSRDGISRFALTTQVLQESEWTPGVIERRQEDAMQRLSRVWDLYPSETEEGAG